VSYLARLAAHQLEEQKDRSPPTRFQARFALASMYDRAASADTQKGSAGGNQAAPAEETPVPPEQAPAPPEQAPAPKAAEPPR